MYAGMIIHSIITNGVSVNSYLVPRRQCIFGQNSSLTRVWALIWTLYCKIDPHLGGFNTDLDTEVSTLYIILNEELADLYSRTLTIQKIIDIFKGVISTNILV